MEGYIFMELSFIKLCITIIFVSMPFGFVRAPATKNIANKWISFAVKMVIIHSPIFIIIPLRKVMGVTDPKWYIILVMIAFSVLGQVIGSRVLPKLLGEKKSEVS